MSSTLRNQIGIVPVQVTRACSSMFNITISATTTEPITVPLYLKYVEVRLRLSRFIMSSLSSGGSTVGFLIAFSVQSRAN